MPALPAADARTATVRLHWPLPAVLSWLVAWALWHLATGLGAHAAAAALVGCGAGLAAAWFVPGLWRRALVAAGFPLSALASGAAAALPAWAWLAALLPLLLAYPVRAWRDAPFFPTPAGALDGLDHIVELPASARVLDAGCGLGHGLRALHALWPQARIEGVEWSRPLRALAARRCPWAAVRRADLWADPWQDCALVYVFQRPESMARVWAKAERELAPGSWLVSLEFAVPGREPLTRLGAPGARPVWVYRLGAAPSTAGSSGR
jgi:SAM-dependent methyltransferase